ncbi:MAG: hypothetical protein NC340_00500 [Ruminococcus flavefaciens]|nr:hypothetical protein [Ruminococcus flavefaciens]MCM1228592.1 hypothetical protein [Ruminococcus flavefaciens]
MQKKKRFSILKLLIVILCITSIIVSLAVNILFSKNNVPNIFGRVIYVVDENNPMEGDITTGSALIAMESADISIMPGDIVICYPADNPESLCLRSVNYVVEAEDGTSKYFTKDSFHEDQTDSITKDKIVAVCTGYPESYELGQFINFAMSMNGILILLVATSVILVIFIIASIVQSHSSKDEEDEIDLYEYEGDEGKKKKRKKNAPLFEPNPEVIDNPELERKKMSIADNFSQKQVNPDSPYQKEREKERTMQFKAQRGNVSGDSLANTMSFSSSSNTGSQSSVSTADALREEMLRKTAEAEKTGVYNVKSSIATSEYASDDTGILSKSEVEQLSRKETPVNEVQNIANVRKTAPSAPRTSSSPDISDIIRKTETERRKKNPSDMSVEDLLKMIENEKKKL